MSLVTQGLKGCYASASSLISLHCLQSPTTKVTLLVVTLLFAGGGIAAPFFGWGIPGIVSFALGGGTTLILLAIGHCANPPLYSKWKKLSDSTLIEQMGATVSCVDGFERGLVEELSEEQIQISDFLGKKIFQILKNNSSKGVDRVVAHLEPLFF